MLNTKRVRRPILSLLILSTFLLAGPGARAQPPSSKNYIPFSPTGFPETPEKMFEQMFGRSTPDEDRQLEKVKIAWKEEREFGDSIVDSYLSDLKRRKIAVTRKGPDVEYLNKLVETLRPFMRNANRYKSITVYVVESPEVDARSVPGGTLFFYKGLLKFARTEAALVGIVGHELAHLDHGHNLLPLKRARLLQRTPIPFGPAANPQTFWKQGTSWLRLMARPFRPEDEAEADQDGADWAHRAGYDCREMAGLFERMQQLKQEQKQPLGEFFRTHPYNEDRFDAIMDRFEALQKQAPLDPAYRGARNLEQRIPKSEQQFEDDA